MDTSLLRPPNAPELFTALVEFVVGTRRFAAIAVDADSNIVFVNQGAVDVWGAPKETLLGKPLRTLFTETDRAHGIPESEIGSARKNGYAPDERWHLRADGSLFWAAGTLLALHSNDGQLLGFWKLFRDRTVRKQTEQKIQKSRFDLEGFASSAAHDLKEPLRTISLLLQTIERNAALDEKSREHLQNAIGASQRAHALVGDMLVWGEVRHAPRDQTRVEVDTVVDLAISTLHGSIQSLGGFVTRGVLPVLFANAVDLQRLFQNLISNGLKYHGTDPPRIAIDVTATAEEYTFTVCDNGVGIAPHELERIFEPFQRIEGNASVRGTGLGLALCRAIVENHGGRIWAESTPGKGTTVLFTLPVK